jgi:hypothetical protein
VKDKTIEEIWNQKEYKEIREKMRKGESPFKICKMCRDEKRGHTIDMK